jgi:hypothetical protein
MDLERNGWAQIPTHPVRAELMGRWEEFGTQPGSGKYVIEADESGRVWLGLYGVGGLSWAIREVQWEEQAGGAVLRFEVGMLSAGSSGVHVVVRYGIWYSGNPGLVAVEFATEGSRPSVVFWARNGD